MKAIVDLNSDMGESFGDYVLGLDEEVIKHVTSVNIACGFHGGDPLIMEKTVREAVKNQVAIGAHPGYPDLMGFGRRNMDISPIEARSYMLYQLGALSAFAKANGSKIQHIKLHGAFYNTANNDEDLSDALLKALVDLDEDIILMALSGSLLAKKAEAMGIRLAQEVFADRAYNDNGSLVSRKLPGAIIHDKDLAIERIKKMIFQGKVDSINGKEIPIVADSICVHGDNPQAVSFVKYIRESLIEEGIQLKSLNDFI